MEFIDMPVAGITVIPQTANISEGDTNKLIAMITPSNATNQNVTWTSLDNSIATVNNSGVVTAQAIGYTHIVATTQDGNFQDSCLVTIIENIDIAVTGVILNEHAISLKVDSTETLLATINPSNATTQNITWESRDENIATVNNGLVTAIAEGETSIVAITEDSRFKDSCLVTVETNVGINDIKNQETVFKIYPNPVTNEKLKIESGKWQNSTSLRGVAEAIYIYDIQGKLVGFYPNALIASPKGRLEGLINISHLPNGTYLLKVGDTSTKVVKQ